MRNNKFVSKHQRDDQVRQQDDADGVKRANQGGDIVGDADVSRNADSVDAEL